jgi:hypothetical protein
VVGKSSYCPSCCPSQRAAAAFIMRLPRSIGCVATVIAGSPGHPTLCPTRNQNGAQGIGRGANALPTSGPNENSCSCSWMLGSATHTAHMLTVPTNPEVLQC